MILRTIVVSQLEANCYLVVDEATKAAVIIDPGDDPDEIVDAIQNENADLKYILLTHGHFDHSFSAGELQQVFDVDVLMHEADIPLLEGSHELVTLLYDIDRYVKPGFGRFLTDGDTITFGEMALRVVHTPGHSQGGLCFIGDGIAFTGDTLFAGSIGRSDLPGGSHPDLIRSIHNKLLTLPDDTIVYPGHGPTSTIGTERTDNPWLDGE